MMMQNSIYGEFRAACVIKCMMHTTTLVGVSDAVICAPLVFYQSRTSDVIVSVPIMLSQVRNKLKMVSITPIDNFPRDYAVMMIHKCFMKYAVINLIS